MADLSTPAPARSGGIPCSRCGTPCVIKGGGNEDGRLLRLATAKTKNGVCATCGLRLATDGPDPTPCDSAVFRRGETAFVTHSIPSNAMEQWVQEVRRISGQRVDWHFAGARAVVLFLPRFPLSVLGKYGRQEARRRVFDAVEKMKPEHNRLYWQSVDRFQESIAKFWRLRSRPATGE